MILQGTVDRLLALGRVGLLLACLASLGCSGAASGPPCLAAGGEGGAGDATTDSYADGQWNEGGEEASDATSEGAAFADTAPDEGPDVSEIDAIADTETIDATPEDAAPVDVDAGDVLSDLAQDGSDAMPDVTADQSTDVGVDVAADANADDGADVSADAGADASADAGADASAEAGADAVADAVNDAVVEGQAQTADSAPAKHGFAIKSDSDFRLWLTVSGPAADAAPLTLSDTCTTANSVCTWSYRNGMIFSDADPSLAINAAFGAREGAVLKLSNLCTVTNSSCTWTYKHGEFLSDADPALGVNAWGGSRVGAPILLTHLCSADNPDCTWTLPHVMI
ncbi:MAG TPA: hypothetical protein VGY54_11115, partial [Polyangiaceae bacterium]|nr:hypothetical protein [Polyangiaceae bacterium]